MTYILKNATVITMDDQRVFYNTDLFVANGRILKIARTSSRLESILSTALESFCFQG